ncbi:hypothetical protein RISK_004279 [Rhodopirellula islandica]|uniref:Uncharacterized protein n=1 Tax=Rhodopirellula islandica TaxID=595434 RepID=A0A0J1BB29_RHOIS|nr:hypothetical protein RISK_004279 [Rhodopirellula islandica]
MKVTQPSRSRKVKSALAIPQAGRMRFRQRVGSDAEWKTPPKWSWFSVARNTTT